MKILALTSIRSDYDLLSPLYKLLKNDNSIDFKLLVSGAHLSESFGYTKQHIDNDGYEILLEIETLINSDTQKSRLKTASIFLQNSIDIVFSFKPDVLLYAGDREDVIMGALLGIYLGIPTIHFYGGDHEEDGHQDTYIRHATSKLSSLHFVSSREHEKRLIRMGEFKNRIFNIGSISLDKFYNFKHIDIREYFNITMHKKFALLIFHPLVNENSSFVFSNILKVLEDEKIFTFVSYPNTDSGYEQINKVIERYKDNRNFLFYKNLDRDVFLSLFYESDFIIGNSSAGIYEAATIKKAVINVGLRQKGRMCSDNVVFTGTSINEISNGIHTINLDDFKCKLHSISNPYGDGKSALKAYKLIKKLKFNKFLIKCEDPLRNES